MSAHPRAVTEPSREIDVIHETDVLVVGSGPGGLAAALAAARAGVEVALVERFGCFGGNITTVSVDGFAWDRREQTVDAGGIGWEFEQRAKEMGAAGRPDQLMTVECEPHDAFPARRVVRFTIGSRQDDQLMTFDQLAPR